MVIWLIDGLTMSEPIFKGNILSFESSCALIYWKCCIIEKPVFRELWIFL